jgi:hypothetical protein
MVYQIILLTYIAIVVTYFGFQALRHLRLIESDQNRFLARIIDELQKARLKNWPFVSHAVPPPDVELDAKANLKAKDVR